MFCPNCGIRVADNARFCFNCGKDLEYIKEQKKQENTETRDIIKDNEKPEAKELEKPKEQKKDNIEKKDDIKNNKSKEKLQKEEPTKQSMLCLEKKEIKQEEKIKKESIFHKDNSIEHKENIKKTEKSLEEMKKDFVNELKEKISKKTLKNFTLDEEEIKIKREKLIPQYKNFDTKTFFIYNTSYFNKMFKGIILGDNNLYICGLNKQFGAFKIEDVDNITYNGMVLKIKNVTLPVETEKYVKSLVMAIWHLIKDIQQGK